MEIDDAQISVRYAGRVEDHSIVNAQDQCGLPDVDEFRFQRILVCNYLVGTPSFWQRTARLLNAAAPVSMHLTRQSVWLTGAYRQDACKFRYQ